jgi:hypothetical protein
MARPYLLAYFETLNKLSLNIFAYTIFPNNIVDVG